MNMKAQAIICFVNHMKTNDDGFVDGTVCQAPPCAGQMAVLLMQLQAEAGAAGCCCCWSSLNTLTLCLETEAAIFGFPFS
jgi:hypothetical protein